MNVGVIVASDGFEGEGSRVTQLVPRSVVGAGVAALVGMGQHACYVRRERGGTNRGVHCPAEGRVGRDEVLEESVQAAVDVILEFC